MTVLRDVFSVVCVVTVLIALNKLAHCHSDIRARYALPLTFNNVIATSCAIGE